MSPVTDFTTLTLHEALDGLAKKDFSAREAMEAHLDAAEAAPGDSEYEL